MWCIKKITSESVVLGHQLFRFAKLVVDARLHPLHITKVGQANAHAMIPFKVVVIADVSQLAKVHAKVLGNMLQLLSFIVVELMFIV